MEKNISTGEGLSLFEMRMILGVSDQDTIDKIRTLLFDKIKDARYHAIVLTAMGIDFDESIGMDKLANQLKVVKNGKNIIQNLNKKVDKIIKRKK